MPAFMCSRDSFIQLGDVRLRLCVEGAGPALLLLHGWALDAAMWQPQFAALAPRLRLIAIDRRGFGLSSGEPDLAREVDDVLALLEALAIGRTVILGMSQAARVALQFAQRFPHRVDCLILDGPPHPVDAAMDDVPIAHYRKLVQREGMDAFRRQWSQHPFMHLHSVEAQTQSLLSEMLARYPGRDLQRHDAEAPRLEANLSAIDVATLVINGEIDLATRLTAGDELVQRLPNAQHVLVRGAGHLPNLDRPAAYNELVLDFIRDHTTAPIVGIG